MKRKTVADLMAEIDTLKKRITELEARPPFVIHNHPAPQLPHQHYPGLFPAAPGIVPYSPPPWQPGRVWCGTAVATAAPAIPWNGPRNPDGSCAPLGSMTMTTGA